MGTNYKEDRMIPNVALKLARCLVIEAASGLHEECRVFAGGHRRQFSYDHIVLIFNYLGEVHRNQPD